MSNWDKWLSKDSSRRSSKRKNTFDDYDGEFIEKSKSKRKSHRDRSLSKSEEFQDRLY